MAFNVLSLVINVLFLIHHQHQVVAQSSNMSAPPAVIVFGDSRRRPPATTMRSHHGQVQLPAYGKDFVRQQATGRSSYPPYLGVELDDQDLLTGVSFASGGGGYDPLTADLVSVLKMDDQLKLFQEYKRRSRQLQEKKKADYIISQSLYLIVTGTDDLANTYFTTPFRV
uniref:GDSL esterase/lipase n=1 Tax=Ananas comosus var. bracteatus TaxID=296719 RepID=A0A6V7PY56_ANACO|nr:unnamed protein product [Ananas comosus var. bracteatus]